MYTMTEVNKVPDIRVGRRNAPHVNQLRAFMASGKKNVVLGVPTGEVSRAYLGLQQASKKTEFRDRVNVRKQGDNIYLIRRG